MRKIIKKTLIFLISSIILSGCFTKWKGDDYYMTPTNSVIMSEFNDEIYIWEDFAFSTNRVDSVK